MKLFKKAKKGFTLVELVVVIAVIAILSAVSVGAYFGIITQARNSAAEQDASQVKTSLQLIGAGTDNKVTVGDKTYTISYSNSGISFDAVPADLSAWNAFFNEAVKKATNDENALKGEATKVYYLETTLYAVDWKNKSDEGKAEKYLLTSASLPENVSTVVSA